VDGVDEAAQLDLYSVADRQTIQLDHGRRDMVGASGVNPYIYIFFGGGGDRGAEGV